MKRLKINKCLNKIIKAVDENDVLAGDAFSAIYNEYPREVHALADMKCVALNYLFNEPISLKLLSHHYVYQMERSEIWLNRILSYVLGILSGLIISGCGPALLAFIQAKL